MNSRHESSDGKGITISGLPAGIIATIVGIWILIQSVFLIISGITIAKTYVETQAVVVDHAIHYDEDGDKLKAEIYEYEVDGTTYQVESISASNHPLSIGETVTIKYNPKRPDRISEGGEMGIGFVLPIFGCAFLFVGIRNIRAAKKEKKQKNHLTGQSGSQDNTYDGSGYLGFDSDSE